MKTASCMKPVAVPSKMSILTKVFRYIIWLLGTGIFAYALQYTCMNAYMQAYILACMLACSCMNARLRFECDASACARYINSYCHCHCQTCNRHACISHAFSNSNINTFCIGFFQRPGFVTFSSINWRSTTHTVRSLCYLQLGMQRLSSWPPLWLPCCTRMATRTYSVWLETYHLEYRHSDSLRSKSAMEMKHITSLICSRFDEWLIWWHYDLTLYQYYISDITSIYIILA